MRNVNETMQYYREVLVPGPDRWKAQCLIVCRTARGIPAMWPSALSAAIHTPVEHRVHSMDKLTRGMVAFFDDPRDSNPYGHIVTVAGRGMGADYSFTNDAYAAGSIDLVRLDFFPTHWGDAFLFGATFLNGEELVMDGAKAKPQGPALGKATRLHKTVNNLDSVIGRLQDSIRDHRKANHSRLVRALERDLEQATLVKRRLVKTIDRFDGRG